MSVARNIADLIHTSGAVGIGTHSPSTLLEVNQDSSENLDIIFNNSRNQTTDRVRLVLSVDGGTTFQIENDQNLDKFKIRNASLSADVFNIFNSATHETLNITNVGVGIGTTGPTQKLNVHAADSRIEISTDSAGTTKTQLQFTTDRDGTPGYGFMGLLHNNGSRLLRIGTNGNSGTDYGIQLDANNNVDIRGNVGIGTTSPDTQLEISSPYNTTLRLSATRNSNAWVVGDSVARIEMYSEDGTWPTASVRSSIDAVVENTAGNSVGLAFKTLNNAERMRITSDGNVGIGITGPDEKLHVSGGNICAGDSTTTFDDGGSTRYIGVGSNSGGDALFIAHSSGDGVGYFGYEAGNDRLIIATDNGGGNNTIEFSVNAGSTATGSTDNLNSASANLIINNDGATFETQTVATLNNSATAGTIAYVSDDGGNFMYKSSGNWKGFTASIGTASNPALSGMQLYDQGYSSGYYYIAISGYSAQRMYVDNSRNGGGWLLMARVTVSSNQAHHNSSSVNVSSNNGPQYQATSTAKMSDAFMNAYRTASPYSGSTAYWMETTGGFTSSSGTILNNFIDTNATIDLVSSAQDQNARTRVATSFQGSLSDRNPNSGTRGLGDHHTGSSYFAYQRHPEQGSNSGFRNDSYGGSDGNLWIK